MTKPARVGPLTVEGILPVDGVWHHVAVVVEDYFAEFYIDGVAVETAQEIAGYDYRLKPKQVQKHAQEVHMAKNADGKP